MLQAIPAVDRVAGALAARVMQGAKRHLTVRRRSTATALGWLAIAAGALACAPREVPPMHRPGFQASIGQPAGGWEAASFSRVDAEDFPGGDIMEGRPEALGSVMLRHAASVDPTVLEVTREEGIPDAVAIGADNLPIHLVYLQARRRYTLRRRLDGTTETGVTELGEADAASIARVLNPVPAQLAATGTRPLGEEYARVVRILRRLVAALPQEFRDPRPFSWFGFTVRPLPAGDSGVAISWVDPEGPAVGLLQVGDRLLEVNGRSATLEGCRGAHAGDHCSMSFQRGTESLAASLRPQHWNRRVRPAIREAPEAVAFAIDDVIAITTGMIRLLNDEDQIAWVLAHELAHVTLGHVTTKLTVSSAIGRTLHGLLVFGIVLPTAPVPGLNQLTELAATGVRNRFRRDEEREADVVAVRYAHAAGFRPEAGLAVVERWQEAMPLSSLEVFIDSHPSYQDRLRVIRAALDQVTGIAPLAAQQMR